MAWLFENPLANMPGPAFLGLYGALLVGIVLFLRVLAGKLETGRHRERLTIAEDLDPFQVAYLRGGDTEVIRTAMVDLVEQGRLVEHLKTGVRAWLQSGTKWVVNDPTDTGADLPDIHRVILRYFSTPKNAESVFTPEIRSQVHQHTAPYRNWTEQEELQVDADRVDRMKQALMYSIIVFEALGAYKLTAALLNQRYNVIFLVIMMGVGAVVILISSYHRKLTQRGRNYLQDVQTAFASLKSVKTLENKPTQPEYAFGDASMPLMATGIFGVGALQGSSLDPFYRSYQQSAANGGGCGSFVTSSCGSSGDSGSSGSTCGSGSGCGGCGGGGGGCGGGGCGS